MSYYLHSLEITESLCNTREHTKQNDIRVYLCCFCKNIPWCTLSWFISLIATLRFVLLKSLFCCWCYYVWNYYKTTNNTRINYFIIIRGSFLTVSMSECCTNHNNSYQSFYFYSIKNAQEKQNKKAVMGLFFIFARVHILHSLFANK